MSHSILTAGRNTHMKAVAVTIIAAGAPMVGFGTPSDSAGMSINFARAKAAKPTLFATREVAAIR